MMATFTVINSNDAGAGSFRDALTQANAAVGADTIAFAIPGTGVKVITLQSALPTISDPVTIDGTTQGASVGPLIEIDGTGAGSAASGLRLTGGSSTLRGLSITNFKLNAVLLASDGNKLEGNFIGLKANGSTLAPNLLDGVQVTGSNNTIGGTATTQANFISGNSRNGISITGATANNNTVVGNIIGLDLFRTSISANVNAGVRIGSGAKNNNIGGPSLAERNFISGNTGFGVLIEGAGSDSNVVQGNFIGNGSSSAVNAGNGVGVTIRSGAKLNSIGTADVNGRNVISGNTTWGVQIRGAGSNDNQIVNNRIGVTESGSVKLANGEDGVLIDTGAANNTIGGITAAHGNLISGNTKSGIAIVGVGTNSNHIWFNTIGLNAAGTAAIGNLQGGVTVKAGATSTEVGAATLGNIISGNGVAGVRIQGASNNSIKGNTIGLNVAKTAAVANALDGVAIEQSSTNIVIGGLTQLEANLISGNVRAGVRISGSGTNDNRVQLNNIGTSADTNAAIGNGIGVWITSGAKNNTIGGASAGNTISGNLSFGVSISGIGTEANIISSNRIGTNASSAASVGNLDGVNISAGAKNNTIGGPTSFDRNFIAGNNRDGVSLTGSTTTGNTIRGNFIGLGTNGLASPVKNVRHGVSVRSGANNNFIGVASATATKNLISNNGSAGIFVADGGSSAIVVNNVIGLSVNNGVAGNTQSGIEIGKGGSAVIGGVSANEGNVISANFGPGVLVTGTRTGQVKVQGNIIGLDPTGTIDRGNQDDGARIAGNNVTIGNTGAVKNVIAGNSSDGIHVLGADNVTIKGNFLGTNSSGLAPISNGNGVRLENSTNVVVGGPTDLERNIISGSVFDGMIIFNPENTSTADPNIRVENNYVGLGVDGATVIPNKDGVQYSTISQPVVFTNNVVSGNTRYGIRTSNTSNQIITGNKIGVQADGVTPAGNGNHGVFLHTNSAKNRIGGELDTDANIIANNAGDGVLIGSDPAAGFSVEAGTGNSVVRNFIFGNIGQAIDLGPNNGATANDVDDVDTGANNLQNAPVITLATTVGDSIFIRGFLDSVVGNYRIDFFAGPTTGQARTYLGSVFDPIASATNLEVAVVLEAAVNAGDFVMAVATNLDTGDSSELSLGFKVL